MLAILAARVLLRYHAVISEVVLPHCQHARRGGDVTVSAHRLSCSLVRLLFDIMLRERFELGKAGAFREQLQDVGAELISILLDKLRRGASAERDARARSDGVAIRGPR